MRMITCSTDINDIYFRRLQQVFPIVCSCVYVHGVRVIMFVYARICVSVNRRGRGGGRQKRAIRCVVV